MTSREAVALRRFRPCVEQQPAKASSVLQPKYAYPHQMHGSIGASCAVADVKGDRVTSVVCHAVRVSNAEHRGKLLGLPLDNVRVVYVRGSGCYGLNGTDAVSFDAAILSHAVSRPVRVQLSRQDEMTWENYGAACVIEQRAGVDQSGAIIAWECQQWEASRGGRPGYSDPANVITGVLVGYEPESIEPRPAAEPKAKLHNRSNAVLPIRPVALAIAVLAQEGFEVSVSSMCTVAGPFFTGPLRSPLRLQNTFAHEGFMGKICAQVKTDPVAFRLRHLRDERFAGVVKAAAEASQWQSRPSPKPNLSRTGLANGRGIACVAYEGDNGYAALSQRVCHGISGHIHCIDKARNPKKGENHVSARPVLAVLLQS